MIADACITAVQDERFFWVKADIKEAFPSVAPNAVLRLIRDRLDSQPLMELLDKLLHQKGAGKGLL